MRLKTLTILLVITLLLGLATVASAQTAAKGNPDHAKAPLSAIDHSGQNAAVDSKGKLRQPTPEEAQALADALAPMLNQTIDESKIEHKADGSVAIFAGDSFANFILMKTNADGTTSTRCVENIEQVNEFLGLTPKKSDASTKPQPKLDANGLEVE